MKRVLAYDPGGTTGWAFKHESGTIEYGQLGPKAHHSALWNHLNDMDASIVVYENFVYQRRELSAGVSLNLDAKEYIGIIKLWCDMHDREIVVQSVSHAKKFCTEDKMAVWGYGLPHAERHAKDALRHLIYFDIMMQKNNSWLEQVKGKV